MKGGTATTLGIFAVMGIAFAMVAAVGLVGIFVYVWPDAETPEALQGVEVPAQVAPSIRTLEPEGDEAPTDEAAENTDEEAEAEAEAEVEAEDVADEPDEVKEAPVAASPKPRSPAPRRAAPRPAPAPAPAPEPLDEPLVDDMSIEELEAQVFDDIGLLLEEMDAELGEGLDEEPESKKKKKKKKDR